jgi:hypothetical protein
MGVACLLGLVGAFAGARGWAPTPVGVAGGLVGAVSGVLTGVLGWRGHRQALAGREKQNRMGMILMVAGQLAKHDDAMLEQVARKGGLAGDAARLILKGRQEKRGQPARG